MTTETGTTDCVLTLPGVVPCATQSMGRIVRNDEVARNTWRMKVQVTEIARHILPGQFFMVRFPGEHDPLLGRPFALLDVAHDLAGQAEAIEFGYVVVGKATSRLARQVAGDSLELWGPLGNGFAPPDCEHLAIAAGGIGQTPFLAVIREALGMSGYGSPARQRGATPKKITMCYGVRTAEFLAFVDDFEKLGIDLRIATEDGSVGHRGRVTDILAEVLASANRPEKVYTCGPEPMMRAVRDLCRSERVRSWCSLETPMACGFGACFSCVTRVRQDDGAWDYKRVCVEGPVFEGDSLVFPGELLPGT